MDFAGSISVEALVIIGQSVGAGIFGSALAALALAYTLSRRIRRDD